MQDKELQSRETWSGEPGATRAGSVLPLLARPVLLLWATLGKHGKENNAVSYKMNHQERNVIAKCSQRARQTKKVKTCL